MTLPEGSLSVVAARGVRLRSCRSLDTVADFGTPDFDLIHPCPRKIA